MKTETEVKEKLESVTDQIEYWRESQQQAEKEDNLELKEYSRRAVSNLITQQSILKWVSQ